MNKIIRIGDDDYQPTGNELQRNLTEDDVNLLLEEYEEVDDTDILKPGMNVRYYTIKQKRNGASSSSLWSACSCSCWRFLG